MVNTTTLSIPIYSTDSNRRDLRNFLNFIVKPDGILLLTKPVSSVKLNRIPFSMMRKCLVSDLLNLKTYVLESTLYMLDTLL